MCDTCNWNLYVDTIDTLLDDGEYDFASDTLYGIRDFAEENEHITEGQKKAVENIHNSR